MDEKYRVRSSPTLVGTIKRRAQRAVCGDV